MNKNQTEVTASEAFGMIHAFIEAVASQIGINLSETIIQARSPEGRAYSMSVQTAISKVQRHLDGAE